MTVVEFFDKKNAIENMLSALLCQPDKVVYIGSSKKQMDAKLEKYRQVLKARCLETELEARGVGRNDLANIVQVLSGIVEETDLCVFNLDGGEDLYLVAAGIIAQRYESRVQLHRFNVRNNTVTDCDADGNDQLVMPIRVGIEENVCIYGGKVVYADEQPGTTPRWLINEEFCQDIRKMWKVCKENAGRWNWVFSQLDKLGRNAGTEENGLYVRLSNIAYWVHNNPSAMEQLKPVLEGLHTAGVLRDLYIDGQVLSFSYKNAQIRQSLLKAGTILELYITMVARGLFEKDERIFHDVLNGVWIDWDGGEKKPNEADVSNEIDVMLMCGAVPVFISCKNGDMSEDTCKEELYKLEAVANRFGGQYAKKVLVITQPDKLGAGAQAVVRRAKKMGIHLLMDVDSMPLKELENQLRICWKQ